MKLALMPTLGCAMVLLARGGDLPPGENGAVPRGSSSNELRSAQNLPAVFPLQKERPRIRQVLDNATAAAFQMVDTNRLESWHDGWSSGLVARVERFDHFFGDARLEDDNRGTWVKVGFGLTASGEADAKLETKLQARLALPGLRERFQLMVDDLVESDSPGEANALVDAARDSRPDTALRWVLQQTRSMRINADAGVRLWGPTQVFGKLRWRRITPFERWELRLSEVVDWYSNDGFGETSAMRWSRPFPRRWLFQSVSALRWQENSDGVRPSQSLGLYKAVSRALAQRVVLDGTWPEAPDTTEAVYRMHYSWRKRIHSDWVFFEIRPGVAFAQINDYRTDPFLTMLLEIVFGE